MSINWNGIGWFCAGLFAAERDSWIAFFLLLVSLGSFAYSEWKIKRGEV